MPSLGVIGSTFSNVSAAQVSVVLTAGVPVGSTVLGGVVWESADNTTPTVSSIVDSKGNFYVVDQSVAGGATAAAIIVRGKVTTALVSGDTITITISAARTRWAISFEGFTDFLAALANTPLDATTNNAASSAATMDPGTTARTTQDSTLSYVVHGLGTGRTFTIPGGWTAAPSVETTAATINRAVKCLHRYNTVIGTQNSQTPIAPTSTNVGCIAVYRVAPARNYYPRIEHRGEGLANGEVLSALNTSRLPFGVGFSNTTWAGSSTFTADSIQFAKGTRSMKAVSVAAQQTYGAVTTPIGPTRIIRGRAFVRITANPAVNLMRFAQVTQGGALACGIGITTSGKLRFIDSTSVQMGNATTASVPLNQWFRVEWRMIASATVGQANLSFWSNANSTGAADETLSSSALWNTRTNFDSYEIGSFFSANATHTVFLDEVVWTTDDAGLIGPYADTVTKTFDFEGGTPLVNAESTGNANVTSAAARLGSAGLRLDARTVPGYLKMGDISFGAGRRWASMAAWMRQPSGSLTADCQLVRFRTTSGDNTATGGHGEIWIDHLTGFIKGDLLPASNFTGATNVNSNWFYLQAVCAFMDNGNSSMKVKINGVEIGNIVSTVPSVGQALFFVVLGKESVADALLDVDSYELSVSDSTLDYIGSAGTPPGTYVRSGANWVIATPYVKSGAVWVQATPNVRRTGSWVAAS